MQTLIEMKMNELKKMKNVCIFGHGIYGKHLYNEISNTAITNLFFCDNKPNNSNNTPYEILTPSNAVEKLVLEGGGIIIPITMCIQPHNLGMIEQLYSLGMDMKHVYFFDMKNISKRDGFSDARLLCLHDWLKVGFSELESDAKRNKNVSWLDIKDRNIRLIGKEKFKADIFDYFNELKITQITNDDDIIEMNTQYLTVICDFDKESWLTKVENLQLNHKEDFIWIEDIIGCLNETETYFTNVYHPNKKIVVVGTQPWVSMVVENNPNMNVCKTVIIQWNEDIRQQINEDNVLIICATSDYILAKHSMQDAGYVFGEDFYLYDVNSTKLASMLYLTIKCENIRNINCTPAMFTSIDKVGSLMHCCARYEWVTGNVLCNTLENIFKSPLYKVMHLSSVNKTFCFCDKDCSFYTAYEECLMTETMISEKRNPQKLRELKDSLIALLYSVACNIKCRSCRNEIWDNSFDQNPNTLAVHKEVMSSASNIQKFCNPYGDVFFSKMAREIFNEANINYMYFNTNGTTINKKNWAILLDKVKDIFVSFSIDGATKETFEYLRRGAKYEVVMDNLKYAAELREAGKIRRLEINTVAQVKNFREFVDIAQMAKNLKVDLIYFAPLRYVAALWSQAEYDAMNIYDPKNPYHQEFKDIVSSNPILQEPFSLFYFKK